MSCFTDSYLLTKAQENTQSFLYKIIITSGALLSFKVLVKPSFEVEDLKLHKLEPINLDWWNYSGTLKK